MSKPQKHYEEVFALIRKHHKLFENSIPLIASENIPSPAGSNENPGLETKSAIS